MPRRKHRAALWIAGAVAAGAIAMMLPLRSAPAPAAAPADRPAAAAPTRYGYRIVNTYPHDPGAFTQGLVFRDGFLYESTGMNGQSSLRKVRLETGEVLQQVDVEDQYFAEGLADWNDRLIQLTWVSQIGFVYDLRTLERTQTFRYAGEGWGLTQDGRRLIMSDGTARLRFLDPETLQETGGLTVTDGGRPVMYLNELEMMDGRLLANVWQSDAIAMIAPDSGVVTGWIDLSGLLPPADRAGVDVLNGIAHDPEGKRLFVTGKLWPKLFEIALVPR
ncbi:MAG TPA: glutaminyl-peptide cyclotransferase [Vicinamibacterales bacterium]